MKKKLNLSIIILGISLLSSTAQIYPVRPQLSDKHSFSMILLPDPQSYNKFDTNQPPETAGKMPHLLLAPNTEPPS